MLFRPRAPAAVVAALAAAFATCAALATEGRVEAAPTDVAQPARSVDVARPAPPEAPDDLTVGVMTFGPGDHPFFRFGHDAIWIHDRATGVDRIYNFGTFTFDSPRQILDFLHGRMTYWLSVSSLAATREVYQRENRSIVVQELALDPDAKRALRTRLDENARPENRAYKYDYFRDNCATRVRDAIDAVVGGRVRADARGPGRLTLRAEALRMTAGYLPLYVALDLVLGPDVDLPIDRWTETFIPEELEHVLAEVTVPATAGEQPLVVHTTEVFHPHRAPPLSAPPARGGPFFLCGLAVGLIFFLLAVGSWASRLTFLRAGLRALFGLLVVGFGLAAGLLGCFLVYIWIGTDHMVAHRNQNILICAPFALALAILGFGVVLGRPSATRKASLFASAALVSTVLAGLVKIGLLHHQENGALIAFFLPVWLGMTAGLARLWPRGRFRAS